MDCYKIYKLGKTDVVFDKIFNQDLSFVAEVKSKDYNNKEALSGYLDAADSGDGEYFLVGFYDNYNSLIRKVEQIIDRTEDGDVFFPATQEAQDKLKVAFEPLLMSDKIKLCKQKILNSEKHKNFTVNEDTLDRAISYIEEENVA